MKNLDPFGIFHGHNLPMCCPSLGLNICLGINENTTYAWSQSGLKRESTEFRVVTLKFLLGGLLFSLLSLADDEDSQC